MSQHKLRLQAEHCRAQAEAFHGPERQLLLKMADLFETLAAPDEAPSPLESIRCW